MVDPRLVEALPRAREVAVEWAVRAREVAVEACAAAWESSGLWRAPGDVWVARRLALLVAVVALCRTLRWAITRSQLRRMRSGRAPAVARCIFGGREHDD